MQKLCRNRAFALESWFRRSTQWAFFQNDNALKHKLFWNNRAKRRCGLSHGASDADRFAQMYGTIVPANIPESTAWWKRQTLELAAITDDAEAGLMQIMVTITQNNRNPEMLAAVRLARFFECPPHGCTQRRANAMHVSGVDRFRHRPRKRRSNIYLPDYRKRNLERISNCTP